MKRLFLFIGILLSGLNGKCQTVDSFSTFSSVSIMPVGGYVKESYQLRGNLMQQVIESRSKGKKKRIVNDRLFSARSLLKEMNVLDSLLKLRVFTIAVSDSLIARMKQDMVFKEYYKIENKDVDAFFLNDKSITIDLDKLPADTLDIYTVYDGRPFSISFRYKLMTGPDIDFQYRGNMDDGVKTKDLATWLPMYFFIPKFNYYDSNSHIKEFFGEGNLRRTLFRFMAWQKEGKIRVEN